MRCQHLMKAGDTCDLRKLFNFLIKSQTVGDGDQVNWVQHALSV